MQRKQMIALVAGVSVGVGGGVLGAFLVWAAAGAVALRLLDQLDDHDIELPQPVLPVAQHAAQQTSLGSVPVTPLASDPSLLNPQEAVTSARAP
jgi:hypothetical protein